MNLTQNKKHWKNTEVLELLDAKLDSFNQHLKSYEEVDMGEIYQNHYSIKNRLKNQITTIDKEIVEIKDSIKKELEQIDKVIKTSHISVVPSSIVAKQTASTQESPLFKEGNTVKSKQNIIELEENEFY